MTVEAIEKRMLEARAVLNPLRVKHDDIWMDANGLGKQTADGKSVFLDCSDDAVRKRVFTEALFEAVLAENWHTDVIRTVADVDTEREDAKVVVLLSGSQMFPDYEVYLASDKAELERIAKEAEASLKGVNDDMELFAEYIADTIRERSCDDLWQLRHAIDAESDRWGVTWAGICADERKKSIVKDALFDYFDKASKYDPED